eukprot:SAG11_NODE_208_length_12354_cov_19.490167_2_plen_99_part_00
MITLWHMIQSTVCMTITPVAISGHNMADLDPLGIQDADIEVGRRPDLWGTGSSTPPELGASPEHSQLQNIDRFIESAPSGTKSFEASRSAEHEQNAHP